MYMRMQVVLKLQYPEARRRFHTDLGNVARLARFALPATYPVVLEVAISPSPHLPISPPTPSCSRWPREI